MGGLTRRKFLTFSVAGAAALGLPGDPSLYAQGDLPGMENNSAPTTATTTTASATTQTTLTSAATVPLNPARPKIDHIGMWTWGGRVYNWQKYLDNMKATGMDTVVLWHYHAPANAREIIDYARAREIKIFWGMNWSWSSPVCLNSEVDAAEWAARIVEQIRYEYIPFGAEALIYQTGGTELTDGCRLNCEVCRAAHAGEGVGPLYVKFVTPILAAVRAAFPQLEICANVHLGAVQKSFGALATLDPAIKIMWEDLPGPGWNLQAPFAYDWDPDAAALTPETLTMVRRMGALRGDREDVAFIVKGFPCHWGGHDPMLLEDFDLALLSPMYEQKWQLAAGYCEKRLADALAVFRAIAEAPARRKTVLLLVEHGLWEFKRSYAAVLIAEALRDPWREPAAVIAAARKSIS